MGYRSGTKVIDRTDPYPFKFKCDWEVKFEAQDDQRNHGKHNKVKATATITIREFWFNHPTYGEYDVDHGKFKIWFYVGFTASSVEVEWRKGVPATVSVEDSHSTGIAEIGRYDVDVMIQVFAYSEIRGFAPSPYWPAGGFVYGYTCVPKTVGVSYTGPVEWVKGVGWVVWFRIDNPDDFGDHPRYFLKNVTVDGVKVSYLVTYDNRIKVYGFTTPEGEYTAEFLWKDDVYETRSRVRFNIPPGEPRAEFVSIDVPSSWPPGTSFSAKFRVRNAGNWEERIWVKGYYNGTYLGEKSRDLGPGEEFSGFFNITMPNRDITVVLKAGHDEWEDVKEERTVRVSAPPPPEKGTIYGTVRDAETGKPIAGASITANGYSTSTDESGYYEIEVDPDTYTVTASKNGYRSKSRIVTVYAGTRIECNFELEPITPPPPPPPPPPEKGVVYGTVRDAETGEPIPDVIIRIDGYTAVTDSSGYYKVEVSPNTYTVTASKTGYEPASRIVTVGAGERVECSFELKPVAPPPAPPPPWWEELMREIVKYAPYIALGVGLITVSGLIAYEVTRRRGE